ncbi:MAG: FCD domain-containing protein [Bacteroidia bacterium]|nr:FCD domain-containing protein [Bacteroidia bacterium]
MADSEHGNSQIENIQEKILDYIREKGYDYNSILPKEDEMAQELGVSRVVVREAYSGLRSLGFIETKRKKGTIFIKPKVFGVLKYVIQSGLLDKDSIKDLYELRLILEIGMADLVVENRTDEKIAELEELVVKEEQCDNAADLKNIDIQFHTVLYSMTGNRSLEYFQTLLHQLFALYTPKPSGWLKNEMMTHRTLVALLKKGDSELFRSAMRIHLENQYAKKEANLSGAKQ